MNMRRFHSGIFPRAAAVLLLLAFLQNHILPAAVLAGGQDDDLYKKWEEIISLRARGEFDRAIEMLNGIITKFSGREEVLRLAYNHLVYSYFLKNDQSGARDKARLALEEFPDLEADVINFPSRMNQIYDGLRREMFGSLSITKPEGCSVFLDDRYIGDTSLHLPLVKEGRYTLKLTKNGYNEYRENIIVLPDGKHNLEISLERQRNKRWWLYRAGPAALALLAGLLLLGGEDARPVEPLPLPEPPDPPTQ
ncbi:MAG: PEGA domain-containing protein [Candidatus Krumholzibacteriota bacterium]|nr:PEGA domain-containing protein [Candidatus Krumholzibacteriota bacterium]